MKFSAVILAGGQSRRMGCDKALLPWHGRPLLAHQLQTVHALQPEQVLISGRVGADYGTFGCPVLLDEFRDRGPLAGIAQALEAICSPLLLVLAVDMPAMTSAFLRRLAGCCSAQVGGVPRTADQLEPLAAFYPKASYRIALDLLTEGWPAVSDFARLCAEAQLVRLHPTGSADHRLFLNWNTPADLDATQARVASLNGSPRGWRYRASAALSAPARIPRLASRVSARGLSPRKGRRPSGQAGVGRE